MKYLKYTLVLGLLFPSLIVSAQELPNTVSCFDYYHFGSVQVSLGNANPIVHPNDSVLFTGVIKNNNSYPVVDIAVYAKIFRKQDNEDFRHINGDYLVDQFYVVKNVSIDANKSNNLKFNWSAPSSMVSGDYNIAFYIVSADRFNLGGLSFTDDIVGTREFFTVENVERAIPPVEWDKNAIQLNNKKYSFAKPIPKIAKNDIATISGPIINPTNQTQKVMVTWTTYNWDGLRNENRIGISSMEIILKPEERRIISYEVPSPVGPVTYVIGNVSAYGGHSIIDVRFAHKDYTQARINFPAVTKFPLEKGDRLDMFSCFSSASPDTIKNGVLQLSLLDEKGVLLESAEYQGDITGNMMGFKKSIISPKKLYKGTLKAQILVDGKVVDNVSMEYDCEKIDKTLCIVPDNRIIYAIVGFIIVMMSGAGIFWGRRRYLIKCVAQDKDALVENSIKGGNKDLNQITTALDNPLPSKGSHGSSIMWVSGTPEALSNDGQTIVRPGVGLPNVSVVLTANITKGTIKDTKTFTLTVLAETK